MFWAKERQDQKKNAPPKWKPEFALGVRKMFKEMQHSYDDDDDDDNDDDNDDDDDDDEEEEEEEEDDEQEEEEDNDDHLCF